MTFFFYQGLIVFNERLGQPLPFLCYLLAFGLTCGVVILWELAELLSDRLIGSRFQASIAETMADQFCGVVGSVFILICIALTDRFGFTQSGRST